MPSSRGHGDVGGLMEHGGVASWTPLSLIMICVYVYRYPLPPHRGDIITLPDGKGSVG